MKDGIARGYLVGGGTERLAGGGQDNGMGPIGIGVLEERRKVAPVHGPRLFNAGYLEHGGDQIDSGDGGGADAGIEKPWPMHGRDLSPLLKNPNADWPYPVIMPATGQTFGSSTNKIPTGDAVLHGGVPWYVMIRERRYKYVRPLITDLEELYDMEKDPDELDNLAVKREHQATLKRLRASLIVELRRHKAGFVDNMPAVRETFPG